MNDWNMDGLMDAVAMDPEGYLVFHERFQDGNELKLGAGQRIFLNQDGTRFHGTLSGFHGKYHGIVDDGLLGHVKIVLSYFEA